MATETSPVGLFALAEHKLAWLDARQRVLAQNIANADTPAYRARDVASFTDVLGGLGVEMARTSPLHLAALSRPTGAVRPGAGEQGPDGNAVTIEQEMTKVADDETAQALTGNIWHSYMSMFMTALGHGG